MSRPLILNATTVALPTDEGTNLLSFLRQHHGLTATKLACGTGDCAACLVLLGEIPAGQTQPHYQAVNSCLLSTGRVAGCHLITLEGLNLATPTLVQQALAEEGGIQCGYCTPGLVVALTAALLNGEQPAAAVAGNLCRCTGYGGIRRACTRLEPLSGPPAGQLPALADRGLLSPAVAQAGQRLQPHPSIPAPTHGAAPACTIVAGETDHTVQQAHHRANTVKPWLRLQQIVEWQQIQADRHWLHLGAAVTIAQCQHEPLIAAEWPNLPVFLDRFASPSIRRSATIGGNLANASPIADLAVVLLALGAELSLQSTNGIRRLPLAQFYLAYHRTALQAGELISHIHIPRRPGRRLHCAKVSKRWLDDIASVNSSMAIDAGTEGQLGTVQLSAGGVAPYPLCLHRTAAALSGQPLTANTLHTALAVMDTEIAPIDDVRGSAQYKRRLLHHLLLDHLQALHPTLRWEELT